MPTVRVTREINNYLFSGGVRAAIIRVLITGIAVFLAVMIVPGLEVHSFRAGLAVGTCAAVVVDLELGGLAARAAGGRSVRLR